MIITIEALQPFKTKALKQEGILPYLRAACPTTYNINLSVSLNGKVVTGQIFPNYIGHLVNKLRIIQSMVVIFA